MKNKRTFWRFALGIIMLNLVFAPQDASSKIRNQPEGRDDKNQDLVITQTPDITNTGTTSVVSVSNSGEQGDRDSRYPAVSADGRFIAFSSSADNLVPGGSNTREHIFVHDRQSGLTERVSVASDGTLSNRSCNWPSISADGRYVAFHSDATNLTEEYIFAIRGVFVHDRNTGKTERVSVSSDGTLANRNSQNPSISADGRYVAFSSMADNLVPDDINPGEDIFVHDRVNGQTKIISIAPDSTPANGDSGFPSISLNGRYVAFSTGANNLIPGEVHNFNIVVKDLVTGVIQQVVVASDGSEGNGWSGKPSISADGSMIAFESLANNLVPGDNNNDHDVFVRNTKTSETIRISINSFGEEGNDYSGEPSISSDGRYVAFSSRADNLADLDSNDQQDIFIHDILTGGTSRVSIASDGAQANGFSVWPSISADGQVVAFESMATNLLFCQENKQPNDRSDIYLHDRSVGLSSISGTVKHEGGAPFPGVTILGLNQTAVTAAGGNYSISDLCPGTYSVNASLWGYGFSPNIRQVSVPPDAAEQNFTGQPLTYSFFPAITKNYCKIAFSDSFGNPTSGWPIFEDSEVLYDYVDGEYRMMSKLPNQSVAASPDYLAENFIAEVQVRNTSSIYGVYGLIFNLAEDWSHFYSFEIDPDGYFGIWRYRDARGWDLLLANHSPHIKTGTATNLIKVRREGSLIEFFSNGHLIASIEESSFIGKHHLGLIISSFDQGYLDVRFDNFFVEPSECQGITNLSGPGKSNLSSTDFRMMDQEAHQPLH